MRRDVPEPWAGWLIEAGLTSPRSRAMVASARQLAERVEVSTTTVMNMMYGVTDTEAETVAAVAAALGKDVVTISRQVGHARTEQRPWEPPFEANLLSRRQQRAISELIRAMAEERETGGNITPNDQAGVSPVAHVRVTPDLGANADVPVVEDLAHRRRALKADQIAADEIPNAARPDDNRREPTRGA